MPLAKVFLKLEVQASPRQLQQMWLGDCLRLGDLRSLFPKQGVKGPEFPFDNLKGLNSH